MYDYLGLFFSNESSEAEMKTQREGIFKKFPELINNPKKPIPGKMRNIVNNELEVK